MTMCLLLVLTMFLADFLSPATPTPMLTQIVVKAFLAALAVSLAFVLPRIVALPCWSLARQCLENPRFLFPCRSLLFTNCTLLL
jgi:hypothetical protein